MISAREETTRIKLTVTLSNFNSKMMRPGCITPKFMRFSYQRGKPIGTIDKKVFRKVTGKLCYGSEKVIETERPDQD